ncbi:MAG: C25 family cysteine peptidase [Candidatus Thermoplasmatota archaeon]|nr:C25 family cysteine peptidase [Candidatus Thermoplasmatota archaeon]
MNRIVQISIISIVMLSFVFSPLILSHTTHMDPYSNNSMLLLNNPDIILVSDQDPFFSILGSQLACWYNSTHQFLKPLLLVQNHTLSSRQLDFLSTFGPEKNLTSIGFIPENYERGTSILGSPSTISLDLAKTHFNHSSEALILPYDQSLSTYTYSLLASPLASYLHIPILFFDTIEKNHHDIAMTLDTLNIETVYLVGISSSYFQDSYETIVLEDSRSIQEILLRTIKEQFGSLRYITITNPNDVIPLQIKNETQSTMEIPVNHNVLYILGKKIVLSGIDTITTQVHIPAGIHKFSVEVTMNNTTTSKDGGMPVFLSATLTDPNGRIIAYGHSPGYKGDATYIETLITNYSGNYSLTIDVFQGYAGGFFSYRGFSSVDTILHIEKRLQTLYVPHYPLIPDLSLNAAYLTSAHGGIIVADEQFGLTNEKYAEHATGHASGPWYQEGLHEFNNEQVDYVIHRLQKILQSMDTFDLLDGYLDGPGWLALLGDTNMIPMYYYPSDPSYLAERGLPSDNPYSLDHQLSTGRIISYTAADASLLIARTFFYEHLCGPAVPDDEWHRKFNFVFGEGFGETGGLFHQIPYSEAITEYGFITEVYGNLRNSRRIAEQLNIYTDANFVEYLGHGDWFWFTPSLYGFNTVGQAIDSVHVREWDIVRPNVFLASGCLMGRVDGVPPMMSIALSFLHAGSNAFIGATRLTGRESGLSAIEDHLIFDDLSLGEALREEKRFDKELPTYYVRVLYGDPAFNPYDPIHGFSDRGMPFGN